MKKNNNKGFTLMEMLIVVAIIAILVAIAIPTFTGSLVKARVAADEANVRAAYSEAMSNFLLAQTEDQGETTADPVVTTAKMQTTCTNGSVTLTGSETQTVVIGDVAADHINWTKGQTVTVTVTQGAGDADAGAVVTIAATAATGG